MSQARSSAPRSDECGEDEDKDLNAGRPELAELCEHLAARIEDNTGERPTINKKWLDATRLMIDRDKRSPDSIRKAIDWCQNDEFWRSNILSMPKLRKHFITLREQAKRRPASQNGKYRPGTGSDVPPRGSHTAEDFV